MLENAGWPEANLATDGCPLFCRLLIYPNGIALSPHPAFTFAQSDCDLVKEAEHGRILSAPQLAPHLPHSCLFIFTWRTQCTVTATHRNPPNVPDNAAVSLCAQGTAVPEPSPGCLQTVLCESAQDLPPGVRERALWPIPFTRVEETVVVSVWFGFVWVVLWQSVLVAKCSLTFSFLQKKSFFFFFFCGTSDLNMKKKIRFEWAS